MSVLLIVEPKDTLFALHVAPWIIHGEYADGIDVLTDRRTHRRQTVTLRFPLDSASVMRTDCCKRSEKSNRRRRLRWSYPVVRSRLGSDQATSLRYRVRLNWLFRRGFDRTGWMSPVTLQHTIFTFQFRSSLNLPLWKLWNSSGNYFASRILRPQSWQQIITWTAGLEKPQKGTWRVSREFEFKNLPNTFGWPTIRGIRAAT